MALIAERLPHSSGTRLSRHTPGRRMRKELSILGVVVALGLVIRIGLLIRSSFLLEGDDSLSTLMALGILQGEHPIMLKNQTYAGAFEPYAMALSFLLFGISRFAAKLPELIFSTGLIASTWFLTREAAGWRAGLLAAALMAVGPPYVLVLTLKPWAPYTEVMLFGSLALAISTRLTFGPQAPNRGLAVGCGLAAGIAFWMHPIAVFFLVPSALLLMLPRNGTLRWRTWLFSLLGFAIGALPVWIFNFQTHGATMRFVLDGANAASADKVAVLAAWWGSDLPRALGLWNPWGPEPRTLSFVLGGMVVVALAFTMLRCLIGRNRRLAGVVVFLVGIPILFVLSGFGGPALNPYGFDATGRYAPPLWVAAAVCMGAVANFLGTHRAILAVPIIGLVIGINGFEVASTDALAAFQSPYWARLPPDNGPLLADLRNRDIQYVWMNHWAAFPAMFDARAAGQLLIAYDWYDVQAGGIDRFPEYLPQVRQSDRRAFVLVSTEDRPELVVRLEALGVSYTLDRLPPYEVVLPVSRTVDPSEVTDALDYRY